MSRDRSRRGRRWVAGIVVVAALVVVVGTFLCWRGDRAAPPSVLLISIDTLRWDRLSAYGYERETSPHLDRLAAEGVRLDDAISTSNWTLPSHISALSGLSPAAHQVEDDHAAMGPSILSLAQVMSTNGRATAGFVSHVFLDRKYGLGRGFDVYDNEPDQPAGEVSRKALAWLKERGDEPFFLFMHFFDPHWDLRPPEPFRSKFASGELNDDYGTFGYLFPYMTPERPLPEDALVDINALYDGEIAYTDDCIGQVLDWLRDAGRLDNTIVVVFSDHGEEITDHGAFGHGTHLFDELIRTPLLVRYPPTIAPGGRLMTPATILDIPATVLTLAGLEVDPQFLLEGRAWMGAAGQPVDIGERIRMAAATRGGPKRLAAISGSFKYLTECWYQPAATTHDGPDAGKTFRLPRVRWHERLHDRTADPGEQRDLLEYGDPEKSAAIAGRLRQAVARTIETHSLDNRLYAEPVPGDAVVYEGVVRLPPEPGEELFGCPPHPLISIEPINNREFRFSLRPHDETLGVVLPSGPTDEPYHLRLARNGEIIHDGPLPQAGPGETRAIGDPSSGCTLAGPAPGAVREKGEANLTPEQIQRLRSLGYGG